MKNKMTIHIRIVNPNGKLDQIVRSTASSKWRSELQISVLIEWHLVNDKEMS